jgi:hypothetical protein
MGGTVRAYTLVMKNFVIIRPTFVVIYRATNNFTIQSDFHHLFKNLSRNLRIPDVTVTLKIMHLSLVSITRDILLMREVVDCAKIASENEGCANVYF